MNDPLKMAELLCTRLCHDLTGPIGAVNNGAEFLSEEGFNMQNQAVDLIVTSAFSAVARLQFYRLAYGNVKEGGEANLSDKRKMVEDFFAGSKIVLDWPDSQTEAAGVSVSIKMARLIFNLLIIASSALIRGGTIAVRLGADSAGGTLISLTATSPHIKWEPEMSNILNGTLPEDDITTKNVQAQLTYAFAKELDAKISHRVSDKEVSFEISRSVQPV